MTPRYRTAFSVPSGFAASTPPAEAPAQKAATTVRNKVGAATRAVADVQRPGSVSDRRGSAAA